MAVAEAPDATQRPLCATGLGLQAQADAFARSMAPTLAALERGVIKSSNAMAKALNERGVASARSGRWSARTYHIEAR
jgi:hypothetical protein